MSELTHKYLNWFRLANSNPPTGFYPFKARFLSRYAVPDGFDLQHVEQFCYTCDGSGQYAKGEACRACDATGIHHVNDHWLQRWNLAGTIYHKPMDHADVYHLHVYKYPEPRSEISGRIQHLNVDLKVSKRAFYRLLLRHEPVTFYNLVTRQIKDRCYWARLKLTWKLIRLRNRLDLFKAIPEDDKLPF